MPRWFRAETDCTRPDTLSDVPVLHEKHKPIGDSQKQKRQHPYAIIESRRVTRRKKVWPNSENPLVFGSYKSQMFQE